MYLGVRASAFERHVTIHIHMRAQNPANFVEPKTQGKTWASREARSQKSGFSLNQKDKVKHKLRAKRGENCYSDFSHCEVQRNSCCLSKRISGSMWLNQTEDQKLLSDGSTKIMLSSVLQSISRPFSIYGYFGSTKIMLPSVL